jgi:60 kDa SS-A/Ro ribonucleoprotein
MARVNIKPKNEARTHEGAMAVPVLSPEKQLRRSVMACMLWEDQFYEDGKSIADRISETAEKVAPEKLAEIAIEAREVANLRHVSLLLLKTLVKVGRGNPLVAATVARVIKRADEPGEMLALYWDGKHSMVPAQLRKGLDKAFRKFDEYQLGKYNGDAKVKLRDVLRIVRPKPENDEQSALWKRVKDRALKTPDTWEVELSAGKDKKETFERLIREGKLGYFALLRNLRNMAEAGVDEDLVKEAILARKGGAEKLLPFRYVAAARAAPRFERELDKSLCASIEAAVPLSGKTIVLVDVSGSMDQRLSGRSDMARVDAAATLASVIPGNTQVFSFSNATVEVPPRKGMAGVDAILRSQQHGGTMLGDAVRTVSGIMADRLIVITDEQSHDRVPDPAHKYAYMINVASYQNGVGYGKWTHIDGFSEGILRYIAVSERQQ